MKEVARVGAGLSPHLFTYSKNDLGDQAAKCLNDNEPTSSFRGKTRLEEASWMALHHAFANSKLANVIKDLHVSLSVVLIAKMIWEIKPPNVSTIMNLPAHSGVKCSLRIYLSW
jgi:hypothetical protein